MPDHIARREQVLGALTEELLGPSPQGEEIDCAREIAFAQRADSYGPWRQQGSGEEILQRDRPVKRYGVGVLYPFQVPLDESEAAGGEAEAPAAAATAEVGPEEDREPADPLTSDGADDLERIARRESARADLEADDYELAAVNEYKPSTMAVTFLADLTPGCRIDVRGTGGRYSAKTVKVEDSEWTWWLRHPVQVRASFGGEALGAADGGRLAADSLEVEGQGALRLEVVAFPRARAEEGQSLITVCLVNRTKPAGPLDEACLFQCRFDVTVEAANEASHILPYPDPEGRPRDEEERSFDLLYRNYQTFAVGHGCAADWGDTQAGRARVVSAEPLPVFEAPNITADVPGPSGANVEVPMAALAGLAPPDDGLAAIENLAERYEAWIDAREAEADAIEERYREAATRHIIECRDAVDRIRNGLTFLRSDERALQAFQLANHAILLQQIRAGPEPRRLTWDDRGRRLVFSAPLENPDPRHPPRGRGSWRPFQIAFLLTALPSVANPHSNERRTVELIWFPTGGGKTEAYLALSAFSLFYRRLRRPDDAGVDVLMRYTLRLLTAQQFQRASALICAMEWLRRDREADLGRSPFSIGIWLGGGTTPNSREDARSALRELNEGRGDNEFLLTRCPWCSGQIGPVEYPRRRPQNAPRVAGYTQSGSTVVFECNDGGCPFSAGLPVYVIDEDIYEVRPSLVIGTVDKFAQLAWRPEARSLFGLETDGSRNISPPSLIVQDELHLISGPLGSMVGIYEAVISELCTDGRGGASVAPKVVSSTATIRRYEEQVKALYARDRVLLFPPRGLEANDSFFARYATGSDGKPLPGRKYVGIHGSGLGSVQTAQVRAFAALLQAPMGLSAEERDPWWTLMIFFNSLRELGTSLSLFQSDIPDYLKVLRNRFGRSTDIRRLRRFLELTGRLRHDEVPKAIADLEVTTTSGGGAKAVDSCLASNIIEVGIDIERLSLMAVVGQPKTTSQYIQVTGRVGRRWWERPALVATIYSASKPRDRSHFEKFRSYHERLYAQVEPTSVTPFSPPVLDRALHAVLVAFVRQAGTREEGERPWPFPDERIEQARTLLRERVEAVDPDEAERFDAVFERRFSEWLRWQRTDYRRRGRDSDIALLRTAGAYASATEATLSWPTPTSLRNVDAECGAQITQLYLNPDGDDSA